MPAKTNSRNWNDVQTAIATAAIVTTLGLWNLFATPAKAETVKSSEPMIPPPTEPPVEEKTLAPGTIPIPTAMPQVKIMFTQGTPQTTVVQQQTSNQQTQTKKKKKKDNNNDSGGSGGGSVSVTQTKTS